MDEHQFNRLEALWTEERRLERAWQEAVWQSDWIEAARIRKEYGRMFAELINFCRAKNIIE